VQILSWRDVDFPGVVLTGLISGYVMTVAGLWAGRVPGLVAVDIADFGRRYMISDRPSAWLLGLASHLVNSVLLVLVWASAIQPSFPGHNVVKGIAWGLVLSLTLAGALVSPLSGLGFMGKKTGSFRFALTNVILHVIRGFLVGLVYTPP
jgi:hypothetical protein